jgi:hypothetical protein
LFLSRSQVRHENPQAFETAPVGERWAEACVVASLVDISRVNIDLRLQQIVHHACSTRSRAKAEQPFGAFAAG